MGLTPSDASLLDVLATEARGAMGHLVGSRNASASYLRARVVPRDRKTVQQLDLRDRFLNAAHRWRTLLAGFERLRWADYAASLFASNRTGRSVRLTAQVLWMRHAVLRSQAGLSLVRSPPPLGAHVSADPTFAATVEAVTEVMTAYFDDTASWCPRRHAGLMIWASHPLKLTQLAPPTWFRYVTTILGSPSAPPTSPLRLDHPYPFGMPASGYYAWWRIRVLLADNTISHPLLGLCQIVTP